MATGPVKIRRTSEFMSCLIAEERERSECSIGLPVSSYSRAATEPPPTFPFLESQCQRAALRHELSLCQRSKATRKNEPRRAARRGYIGRWLRRVKRETLRFFGNFAASENPANSGAYPPSKEESPFSTPDVLTRPRARFQNDGEEDRRNKGAQRPIPRTAHRPAVGKIMSEASVPEQRTGRVPRPKPPAATAVGHST